MSDKSPQSSALNLATLSGGEIAAGLSAGKIGLTEVVAHLNSRLLPAEGQAAVYGALASNPSVMQAVILSQASLQAKAKPTKESKAARFAWRASGKRNVTILPPQPGVEKGDPAKGWCLTSPPEAWLAILDRADEVRAVCAAALAVETDTLAAEILAKAGVGE
jgi:hypothetical protein